jgi:hypothetical protein
MQAVAPRRPPPAAPALPRALPLPELRTIGMLRHGAVVRPAGRRGGEVRSTGSAADGRWRPHVVLLSASRTIAEKSFNPPV